MEKSRKEMRKEIEAMVAGMPGREYQKCLIQEIGREYITFLSLYGGSKSQRVSIESFYSTRDLFSDVQ